MKYETIIDGKNILFDEMLVNETYLTKRIHRSNWYTQIDITEVVIPLNIIFHPNLNFFPKCVNNFPGKWCIK